MLFPRARGRGFRNAGLVNGARAMQMFGMAAWNNRKKLSAAWKKAQAAGHKKRLRRPAAKKSTALVPYRPKARRTVEYQGGHLRADPGAGAELTTERFTFRLGSKKGLSNKLVNANSSDVYYKFGAMSPFMNTTVASVFGGVVGGGAYSLTNYVSSVTPTTAFNMTLPIHVYDITCINNVINGSVTNATPLWVMNLNGTVGAGPTYPVSAVDWYAQQGYNIAGTTLSTSLQLEKSQYLTVQPTEHNLQEWVNVKMLCYGATNIATEWKLTVFQLKDDEFHPYEISESSGVDLTAYPEAQGATNFWEGFSSKSFKHPMAQLDIDYKKHMKVLKEVTFTQQPRLTNESDAVLGHAKQVNMFIPIYRKNNYKWVEPGLDPSLDNVNAEAAQLEQLSCYLKPKSRIYFAVQATNVTQTSTVTVNTTAYCPSYDIQLRYKYTNLG